MRGWRLPWSALLTLALATGGTLMSARPVGAESMRSRAPGPLATADELRSERLAERLVATPQVQAAAATVEQQWRAKLTAKLGALTPRTNASLAPAIRELAFAYAQKAADGDPARPMVSWIESPPHRWFGTCVPGGRYAGDNPDTVYRIVPIDGVSTYRVTGRFTYRRPATTLFQVVTDVNVLTTVSQLDGEDMTVAPDGSFTLTIDPTAGTGTANHLQTKPGTVELFVRDTLSDWNAQAPPTLAVRRVAGPPPAPPETFAQLVDDTVRGIQTQDWIDFFVLGLQYAPPSNVWSAPLITGTTARAFANYHLDDGHALVITADPAKAPYFGVTVQTPWTITPPYWDRQSSLTNDQARPNADGSFTFVLSTRDPGVANWLDTTGLRDGTLFARWQDLRGGTSPMISARLVTLANLDAVLPAGTAHVTPRERQVQLRQRAAGFARRAGIPHGCITNGTRPSSTHAASDER